jgi:hypothetical protein
VRKGFRKDTRESASGGSFIRSSAHHRMHVGPHRHRLSAASESADRSAADGPGEGPDDRSFPVRHRIKICEGAAPRARPGALSRVPQTTASWSPGSSQTRTMTNPLNTRPAVRAESSHRKAGPQGVSV